MFEIIFDKSIECKKSCAAVPDISATVVIKAMFTKLAKIVVDETGREAAEHTPGYLIDVINCDDLEKISTVLSLAHEKVI